MGSRLPVRLIVAISALVAVGVGLTVDGGTAAPPPQSVCGPCHDGLEKAGQRYNVPLRVTDSEATVRVHSNGSATWTITSQFIEDDSPDAISPNESTWSLEQLQQNSSLARAIVHDAVDDSTDYLEPDRPDATLRSMTVTNRSIRFQFHEPDVAQRMPGAVILVDEYHTQGRGSGWFVDVSRLRIIGPPGTAVTNDVRSATAPANTSIDGRNVTVRGSTADPPSFRQNDVYIAFTQPESTAGLSTSVALILAEAPFATSAFVSVYFPGLVVLLCSLAVIYWWSSPNATGNRNANRRLVRLVSLAAVILYLVPTLVRSVSTPPQPAFAIVYQAVYIGFALCLGGVSFLSVRLLTDSAERNQAGSR